MNKHTIKRIERIVSLTVEDFYNSGYSTNESPESLKAWLCEALNTYEGLEDYTTIEISIQVLKLLKSLDMVDLEYIHNAVFEDIKASEVSITFKEVV